MILKTSLLTISILSVIAISTAAFNSVSAATRGDIKRLIVEEARGSRVPTALALAVAKVESNFDKNALSHAGARGVMQVMPTTARDVFGVSKDELWNARLNVQIGIDYLEQLYKQYSDRWDLALSHYNGGSLNRPNGKSFQPHKYTKKYISDVMKWRLHYAEQARIWQAAGDPTDIDNLNNWSRGSDRAGGLTTAGLINPAVAQSGYRYLTGNQIRHLFRGSKVRAEGSCGISRWGHPLLCENEILFHDGLRLKLNTARTKYNTLQGTYVTTGAWDIKKDKICLTEDEGGKVFDTVFWDTKDRCFSVSRERFSFVFEDSRQNKIWEVLVKGPRLPETVAEQYASLPPPEKMPDTQSNDVGNIQEGSTSELEVAPVRRIIVRKIPYDDRSKYAEFRPLNKALGAGLRRRLIEARRNLDDFSSGRTFVRWYDG